MTTLHPILIPTVHDAGLPLAAGALVTYHGRRLGERGSIFYVADVDDDGYTIIDKDYPGVTTMYGLSRRLIRPTGDRIDLCGCGHEAGRRTDRDPAWCMYRDGGDYCGCDLHGTIRND
jgi:hypothetical protein